MDNKKISEIRERLGALRARVEIRGGTIETKEYSYPIKFEIKAAGDDWQVEGYIAAFNNVDLTGDLIIPGAFSKSLKSGRKVRFLFNHDPKQIVGAVKTLKEDSRGLFGRFKISKTALGGEIRELLKDGALDSFSFGYNIQNVDYKGDVRILKQLDLYEASLVSIPANPEAVVTGFKDSAPIISKAEARWIKFELARLGRKYGRRY